MYQLEFTDRSEYLYVHASGALSPETDLAIDKDVRTQCEKRNLHCALIDIRTMESRLSGLENHNAATTFKERMGQVTTVAVIDLQKYYERSEMYQLTTANRDTNIRFFTQEADAVKWLETEINR